MRVGRPSILNSSFGFSQWSCCGRFCLYAGAPLWPSPPVNDCNATSRSVSINLPNLSAQSPRADFFSLSYRPQLPSGHWTSSWARVSGPVRPNAQGQYELTGLVADTRYQIRLQASREGSLSAAGPVAEAATRIHGKMPCCSLLMR